MGFRSQAENARPCNVGTGRVGDRIGSSQGLAEAREGKYVGVLAVLAAATIWGTLGLFLKGLYAQGVAFEPWSRSVPPGAAPRWRASSCSPAGRDG